MATKRKATAMLVEDTEMVVLDDIEIKKEPEIHEEQESEDYELDTKPSAVDKASDSMILFRSSADYHGFFCFCSLIRLPTSRTKWMLMI